MQNTFSAEDLHDIYAIVLHAAQQSNAKEAQQIIKALLQFSDNSNVYALHTALSKINTEGDSVQHAMLSVSDYVSTV